jgi:hypothetical protein
MEQQVKQGEMKIDASRLAIDAAAKQDANQLKQSELAANMQLKGMQMGAQIKQSQEKQTFEQEHSGIKLGAQMAKDKQQQQLDAMQAMTNLTKQNSQESKS